MQRRASLLTIAIVMAFAQASAVEPTYPSTSWETRTPAELGMEYVDYDGDYVFVSRFGYQLYAGGEHTTRRSWRSGNKVYHASASLQAVHDGHLTSLDAPAYTYSDLSEWSNYQDPEDQAVTFRHFNNQMSGLADDYGPGEAFYYHDDVMRFYRRQVLPDVFDVDPELDGDARTDITSRILFEAIGDEDGSNYSGTSARDFARIGLLWMRGGEWDGSRVLRAEDIAEHWRIQVTADVPPAGTNNWTYNAIGVYGCWWWFNGIQNKDGERLWPELPLDTVAAFGAGGNYMFVIPSLELIYTLNGRPSHAAEAIAAVIDNSAPSSVSAAIATDAPTGVQLTWQPASDPESGISAYAIERDGEIIGHSVWWASDGSEVTTYNDASGSLDATYRVRAVNGKMMDGPWGTVTIDDGGAGSLRLTASVANVAEDAAGLAVTVERAGGSSGTASVLWQTTDGSATAGSDYVAASGELTWADGDASDQTIDLSISDDALVEGDETFTLALSDATGAALGTPSTITISIVDDEEQPNQAPVAEDADIDTTVDTPVDIQLAMDDPDGGPGPYSYVIVDAPAHGSLSGTNNDRSYTPASGYTGPDSFTWRVSDGVDDSNLATASITVTYGPPTITAPASADPTPVTGLTTTLSVSAEDLDGEALSYAWQVTDQPAGAAPVFTADQREPTVTFGLAGSYTFSVAVSAGGDTVDGGSVVVSVEQQPSNLEIEP